MLRILPITVFVPMCFLPFATARAEDIKATAGPRTTVHVTTDDGRTTSTVVGPGTASATIPAKGIATDKRDGGHDWLSQLIRQVLADKPVARAAALQATSSASKGHREASSKAGKHGPVREKQAPVRVHSTKRAARGGSGGVRVEIGDLIIDTRGGQLRIDNARRTGEKRER